MSLEIRKWRQVDRFFMAVLMIACVILVPMLDLMYGESSRSRSEGSLWSYEVIEDGNSYGPWFGGPMDLEIDRSDKLHVIYQAGEALNYSRNEGGGWIVETVPGSEGISDEVDLAIDNSSYPHIVHYGYLNGLRYTWKDDEGWHTTADFGRWTGMYPTLSIDDLGDVHFAYTQNGLVYARYRGEKIESWKLGSGNFYGPSLCIDSTGSPRISCSNRSSNELYYYTIENEEWQRTVIEEGSGAFTHTKMVLDANDDPQIAYTVRPEAKDRIDRVWWNGGEWTHEIVDPLSNSVVFDFKIDRNGIPHILTDEVYLWRFIGGSWKESEIDIPDLQGGYDGLEFDQNNTPHLIGSLEASTIIHVTLGDDEEYPVADAGRDRIVQVGETVMLDGTGSYDDTGIRDYIWRVLEIDGLELRGSTPSIEFNTSGNYTVVLRVIDLSGKWGEDTAIIRVNDEGGPIADAGDDITVPQYTKVTFDGSGSSDDSGKLNFTWTFVHGERFELYGERPSFLFRDVSFYLVMLTVKDPSGYLAVDYVNVYVTDATPPVMGEVFDQSGDQYSDFVLIAPQCSDGSGIISYNWTIVHGSEVLHLSGARVSFTLDYIGIYLVMLQVMDGAGNFNSTSFKITSMDATPPSALIICPSNVTEGDLVELDGSGSTDNVGITNWTWWVDFQGVTEYHYGAVVRFSPDEKGLYYITLQVRDDRGLTSIDSKVMEVREAKKGGIEFDPWFMLFLIISVSIIILILMVISLLMFFRRKRKTEDVETFDFPEKEPEAEISFGPRPHHDQMVSSGSLYIDLEE